MGWIIAIIAALFVASHNAANQGTQTSGTTVTTIPVNSPLFNVSPPQGPAQVRREPIADTFQNWQNGAYVPVPTGSRMDNLAPAGATSDSVTNQMYGLRVMSDAVGGGPRVINPPTVVAAAGTGIAATGSAGTGSGATGGGTGGTGGGGGGFSGRGRLFPN